MTGLGVREKMKLQRDVNKALDRYFADMKAGKFTAGGAWDETQHVTDPAKGRGLPPNSCIEPGGFVGGCDCAD